MFPADNLIESPEQFQNFFSIVVYSQPLFASLKTLVCPRWLSGRRIYLPCRRHRRLGFSSWVKKILWRRAWQPTPEFLPEKADGQRSLVGHSSWCCKEANTTEATELGPAAPRPPMFPSTFLPTLAPSLILLAHTKHLLCAVSCTGHYELPEDKKKRRRSLVDHWPHLQGTRCLEEVVSQ